MGKLVEVTDATFGAEVEKPRLTLVKFWAAWCGPCRAIAPIVEELAARYQDKLTVVGVNVDESPDVAANCAVANIPTMVFFKEGRELGRIVGGSREKIESEIRRLA